MRSATDEADSHLTGDGDAHGGDDLPERSARSSSVGGEQAGEVASEVIGRPTVARIDAAAVRANFAAVRATVAPDVAVLATVKADAYGHGAELVARVLAEAGADVFGVATVQEGVDLRRAGITQPVLVMAGAASAEVEAALACRLSVAVVDVRMVRGLAAVVSGRHLPVHVKLDTGMTRLGVMPDLVPELIDALRASPCLQVEGVFSHFADADSARTEYADRQVSLFQQGVASLRAAGFSPRWVHLANSVAALTRADSCGNLVRAGIVLYGVPPGGGVEPGGWCPVMHLCTGIWQLKSVPASCPVSYGQTFVTQRPSRIAVLPIGYADGYARALSNRAEVLIRERRAPVIGRVCMDVTMVDVTDIPQVSSGDEVVLWGRQGSATLSVSEVAAWQGTIPYEVLTGVGKRVPRVLIDQR